MTLYRIYGYAGLPNEPPVEPPVDPEDPPVIPGSYPSPVFNVMNYGATANGTTNDSAAFQSALTAACNAGGGTCYIPAGTYAIASPIRLPANNSNNVYIHGYGATIRLTSNPGRFLVWHTSSSGQTYKKYIIQGMTVDCLGNIPPSKVYWGPLMGDQQSSAGGSISEATYMNIENITVKDVTVLRVPTQAYATDSWNACVINMRTYGSGYHITDCLFDNVHIEGGQRGINVWGASSITVGSYIDNIKFHNCWHDTMRSDMRFHASSNYHIGQYAKVGYCEFINCYGNRSADVGIEVDQPSMCVIDGCEMNNSRWNGYYLANFSPLMVSTTSSKTYIRNSTARMTQNIVETGGQRFCSVGAEAYKYGDVEITDCSHYIANVTGDQRKTFFAVGAMSDLIINNMTVTCLAPAQNTAYSYLFYYNVQPDSKTIADIWINSSKVA